MTTIIGTGEVGALHSREELEEMQRLPLQRKIQITTARIIEWYQHYDGKVYVAFSGGKDSTVLLDIVRRIYPDVPAVFSDTGLEFPEVREFVKSCENVTIVRPEMNFRKVIEVYGYPVISKRVADTVEYGHKPGSFRWKELHGEIMRSNGTPSEFNCEKWCYLLDAPFKVSSRCCTVMKKRPMKKYSKETGRVPIIATMANESRSRRATWLRINRDLEDGIKAAVENKATLNDLFELYMANKPELKDTTRSNYLYMYNKYVRNDIGKKKIASIKYSDVKAFYNKLIKEKGFKPNSMEIIHTIIHPVFTLAVRDNYIRINPATGAMAEIKKSHNWEKPKRHALTIAEQTAFIDYMRNHKVYNHWLPLFTVLLGTGCRIGEAIGLRWEDCDFDEGIISINHNMVYRKYEEDEKARFHIVTPKTSAGVRIVPMLSEVKAALQSEWETQKIVGFNESVVDGYAGFIFQNRYGDPLSPHSVNRAIDRICAAYIEDETVLADQEGRDPVLIRHFSAHNLRHTFCTRFCENERNIKVIQEIMGHADIETTMNIYAEATKEKKKESFSNLEGKIKIS